VSHAETSATLDRKFRQAAFVYLHVGLLYEFGVLALWRNGLLGDDRGHPLLWLGVGAGIVAVVFWGLWRWRNRWFARAIWAVHSLRLPALIGGAFLAAPGEARLAPALYQFALVVVVINLWMLARAGWDL
jgi:hypothetical protein